MMDYNDKEKWEVRAFGIGPKKVKKMKIQYHEH